jgi:hypothetical protein
MPDVERAVLPESERVLARDPTRVLPVPIDTIDAKMKASKDIDGLI